MPTGTELLTLPAVRLLGYADTPRLARRFDLPPAEAEEHLLDAEARGWVTRSSFGSDTGWSLTGAGRATGESWLAAELDRTGARAGVDRVHAEFLPHNHTVTELCTAWQLAETGIGDAVSAARTDPAWITATE